MSVAAQRTAACQPVGRSRHGERRAPRARAAPLIEVRDVSVRFGGIVALDKVSFTIAERQSARPDRPERRRQDHAVQLLFAALHARLGRHRVRGALDPRPPAAPHRRASASAARSRTSRCSAPCRCSTMCASAAIRSAARDFISNALKLPWTRREEQALADIAWELIEFLDLRDVAHRRVADLPFGIAEARRACARARGAAEAAAARRAGRRPQPHRNPRARRTDPAHPRRAQHHHPAGRASHEHGDVDLRQGGGARFRQEDRRGHAGASAER